MELATIDIVIFVVFLVAVIAIGLWKSRGETDSEDYFLAGRGLNWWLIGFSLIAANISAEQFVGMSGAAAKDSIGLAVASYEWCAAITLVVVAFCFLPTFLRSGIFTIPQFLEHRFDHASRTVMSLLMVIILAGVTITAVIYMGAKALNPLFEDLGIMELSWIVGIAAAVYVAAGGLKACAWADLIQGTALIAGGAVIMVLSFMALDKPADFEGTNAVATINTSLDVSETATVGEKFASLKEQKMHMALPRTSTFLPWTALLLGIWIPNFYYWGLNQYIMQRTLGAKGLADGQKGVVFAAGMKLIIPFIVCVPGIIAFTLYSDKMAESAMDSPQLNGPVMERFEATKANPASDPMLIPYDADFVELHPQLALDITKFNAAVGDVAVPAAEEGQTVVDVNDAVIKAAVDENKELGKVKTQTLIGYDYDNAFPLLIRYLTPQGLRGFVVAALMGAVISSLASMLNAASTIFTMDIYREWFHKNASQKRLIWVGRICVPICVVIGCVIAPKLADPKFAGAFAYIQEFQGFVSPGILTIFLFGLFVPWAPRICGVLGLILSPIIYGALFFGAPDIAFLNRMAITVGAIAAILLIVTLIKPLKEPIKLPEQTKIPMHSSKGALVVGVIVCIATVALYVVFW